MDVEKEPQLEELTVEVVLKDLKSIADDLGELLFAAGLLLGDASDEDAFDLRGRELELKEVLSRIHALSQCGMLRSSLSIRQLLQAHLPSSDVTSSSPS